MICPSYDVPKYLIFSAQVPSLLYYSHLPAIVISLLIGFFVYFKNRHSLLSKILLAISVTFSFWAFINLITWTNNDSNIIFFAWSFFGILYALLSLLCLYFVYVFIDKKDLSLNVKALLGLLLLPIILFTPTNFNLSNFDLTVCGIFDDGRYFTSYYYGIGFLVFAWILILSFQRHRKAEKEFKKQIILLALGIELFLLSFFSTGFIASYLVWTGASDNFAVNQYGLFGMIVFMGFLAYLIVKFKAFNIKLLGAQFLVAFLVFFVGSLLFIGNISTMRVIVWITLAIALAIGLTLIKSVKKEVKQKEALEIANQEINERKDQLQKMADSLSITNERLKVANEKLKVLDQAKSSFFTRASHDLRNPVTSIKGNIFLVLKGSFGAITDKTREVLQKSYDTTRVIMDLIDDFMTAAQLETGDMKYNFAKCKLEDICQSVVDMFDSKAKEGGIYLKFQKMQESLPELIIDAFRIRESIANLIDNAIKYTEKGGVTVTIEKADSSIHKPVIVNDPDEKVTPEIAGPVVRVTVSDTGIGIPEDGIQHLFSKFSRGNSSASRKKGGHGLGLYFCRMMVEGNGGKVWAESEGEGKGSRFIAEFPVNPPKDILNQFQAEQKKQKAAAT